MISIQFTEEQLHEIIKYTEYCGATTIQYAIMNAISIAFDNSEPKEHGEGE